MLADSPPFYTTIVSNLMDHVNVLLNSYVFNGYQALSNYLAMPVFLITTLSIVILGFGVMLGSVKVNINVFGKFCIKIGIIYTVIYNWGFVSYYFIGLVNSMIGGAGDALIAANPFHTIPAQGITGAMQLTLNEFTQVGNKIFSVGGYTSIAPLFDGLLIWFFGYVIIGLGLMEILLAKLLLAILFVFTPLIVLSCYFKWGQSIFDRWLGAIIGCGLVQLFVTVALSFALSIAYWWVDAHVHSKAIGIGSVGTLPVVIIGLLCIGMILKATSLAQNLGGTISTSSGMAMMSGVVGGAMGAAGRARDAGRRAGGHVKKHAGRVARHTYGAISENVMGVASSIKGFMNNRKKGG